MRVGRGGRSDWGREASLVRPAKLTLALFAGAPALDPGRPWVPERLLPLTGTAIWELRIPRLR